MRLFIRFVLAAVFISAAILKAIHAPGADTLYGSMVPQGSWQNALILSGEFLIGLWLLVGWWLRPALLVTLSVLAIFTGVLAGDLRIQYPKPCGCLGASKYNLFMFDQYNTHREVELHILCNALLLMGGTWLLVKSTRTATPKAPNDGGPANGTVGQASGTPAGA